jgi:polysaccharide biosynthesis/export protein
LPRKNQEYWVSDPMPLRREVSANLCWGILGGMVLLQACAGGRFSSSPIPSVIMAEDTAPTMVAASEYTFGVGDAVDIKLYYHPDLNEIAVVRSDGKISLQLIGDVVALGATSPSLSQHLREQYAAAGLRDPIVTVMLRKSIGQKVFVGGEVASPKMVSYEGRLSLAQALFEAGGLKSTAQGNNIVLLRDDMQGKPLVMVVSLEQIFEQQRDVALHPYDVVFVPKSTIARVNEFVEQYIVKVLPFSMNAGFQYLLGAAAIP